MVVRESSAASSSAPPEKQRLCPCAGRRPVYRYPDKSAPRGLKAAYSCLLVLPRLTVKESRERLLNAHHRSAVLWGGA